MHQTDYLNYLSIEEYLEQEQINKDDLLEQLNTGEAGLFVRLENIKGIIRKNRSKEEITDHIFRTIGEVKRVDDYRIEVTGHCLLSDPYLEILKSDEPNIDFNSMLKIYEGELKILVNTEAGTAWKTVIIDPNLNIWFLPDKKSTNGVKNECCSLPRQDLLVAKTMCICYERMVHRMVRQNEDVCLEKIVRIFWSKSEDAKKNEEVYDQAKLAINSGELSSKQIDNKQFVNPEKLVYWMIDRNLFPEQGYKHSLFRCIKYTQEYKKLLLDNRKYAPLPKDKKDDILQSAIQAKINLFFKIKNKEKTLTHIYSKNHTLEEQEPLNAYKEVIKKRIFWSFNDIDFPSVNDCIIKLFNCNIPK